MAPVNNKKNILEGPVHMYIGNSAESGAPDVMPADTVPFGGNVGGSWRSVGYTSEDGVVASFGMERGAVRTAQSRQPVLRPITGFNDHVTGMFLETTLTNIRDALGRGEIITVAAGSGTPGHDELTLTNEAADTVAILLEGVAPPSDGGQPRRIFFPNTEAVATVEHRMRQGEAGANAGVAFDFARVGDEEASRPVIRDVLAAL